MEIVGDLENEDILGDEEKLRSDNIYSCNYELQIQIVLYRIKVKAIKRKIMLTEAIKKI